MTLMLSALAASSAMARSGPQLQRVVFAQGTQSEYYDHTLAGGDTRDYVVNARQAHTLAISLHASSGVYFTVHAQGRARPVFDSMTDGPRLELRVPQDGRYTIHTHLAGALRQSGRPVPYQLHIALTDADAGSTRRVPADTGPARYDASGSVGCTLGHSGFERQCGFRVVRNLRQRKADIWIANPAYSGVIRYRVLQLTGNTLRDRDGDPVSARRQDDNWLVDVAGREHYLIPDAALLGG
ncbi:hypothetical protein BJP62_07160 [Jeongeupia sp. USM3]|nr:hypothetical protein BJP62_07160 [Jeongeupia sp. USM3]